MTALEITDKGNRFAVRFFALVLLAHFVVVAPTFDPPPKMHATVGDAKDQVKNLRAESTRHRKAKQNLADLRGLLASTPEKKMNSRGSRVPSIPSKSDLLKETQKLEKEEDKTNKERQTEIENELKMDEKLLELDKLKTPRQFSVPGVTTFNANDILKLYLGVVCLGLLQLLEYRRKLIDSKGPVRNWPMWAAPVPFTPSGPFWRPALLNFLWIALLGLLYFTCSDVARREEFYGNPKLLSINVPLGGIVIGWYVGAFVRAFLLSIRGNYR